MKFYFIFQHSEYYPILENLEAGVLFLQFIENQWSRPSKLKMCFVFSLSMYPIGGVLKFVRWSRTDDTVWTPKN